MSLHFHVLLIFDSSSFLEFYFEKYILDIHLEVIVLLRIR